MSEKCPRCGADYRCDFDSEDEQPASVLYKCGTFVYADGNIADGWSCLHHQRDALRAEVARSQSFAEGLQGELTETISRMRKERYERDAAFQRARGAWKVLRNPDFICQGDEGKAWYAHDEAKSILREFFGGGEGEG